MRYTLIDYMHLAHRCIAAQPLSSTVMIDGELQVVDTTIPNYTIKNVVSYGGRGLFHTGVFLEGGSCSRKKYFSKESSVDGSGYKGNRGNYQSTFFQGVNLATQLMLNGKVSLYRCEGFEADDLIYAMIQCIKEVDSTTPIDVITNDADLLPLVDDQVSVYMRGTREYAEEGCPVRRLYYQVTPRSWDDYLSYSSAYKAYNIPYNSMLLYKMIKGDPSDNIDASCKGYGGVKYSKLMDEMKTSVFMKKEISDIVSPLFKGKSKEVFSFGMLENKIRETYVPKGKENLDKLLEYLQQYIKGAELEKKGQTAITKWLPKLDDSIVSEITSMKEKYHDLNKWFKCASLVDMKNEGTDLIQEFQRVFSTYFTQADYDNLVAQGFKFANMFTEGVDFENIFRYGVDFDTVMKPVLEKWFTPEEIAGMKYIYNGICLRPQNLVLPKQMDMGYLQQALQPVKINVLKVR